MNRKSDSGWLTPFKQLIIAASLFAALAVIARDKTLSSWEITIFETIYNWPGWLNPFFLIFTQLASIYFLALVLIIVILKPRLRVFKALLLGGTLAYSLAVLAKFLVGRPRPITLLANVTYHDLFVPGAGFPSAHVALATAAGLIFMYTRSGWYRWLAPLFIILIALSRIYLGVHAPLDILGGLVIGWFTYAVLRYVDILGKKRLEKS